jgi:hypothetical protein
MSTYVRKQLEREAKAEHEAAQQHLIRAHQAEQDAERRQAEARELSDDDAVLIFRERARKKTANPLLVLAVALLASSTVHAAEPTADTECTQSEPGTPCIALHPIDAERGIWLPRPVYLDVLSDLAATDGLRVALDEHKLAVARLLAEREHLLTSRDREIELSDAMGAARDREAMARLECEERAEAWWRSPWLWLNVGLLVGGVAVTSVALAVAR